MLVNKIVQLAVFVLAIVWDWRCNAATAAVKLCGRELSDFMSRVCHAYNSPSWDVPTVNVAVIEQPAAVVRRRRRTGIVDECCVFGCTWEQLSSYCAISAKSPLDSSEAHMIADRSAEAAVVSPAVVGKERVAGEAASTRREGFIRSAARAAPVLGTVSPLLTWGRTLNTDLPSVEKDRYAYVAVYT
ncbi:insulin-like growth factor isoform X2 [Pararge aegeria]|uniref:insulin-like growth factor isoform X2 n=1 Tax=Pararge aegeria TaxID=116150 RepID=UPI0019D1AE6A|nr:insulin-like growth factor isoform X2 [Pararge aegeria]